MKLFRPFALLFTLTLPLRLLAQTPTPPTPGSVRSVGNLQLSTQTLIGHILNQGSQAPSAAGIVLALDASDLVVNDPQAITMPMAQADLPQATSAYPFAFTLTATPQTPLTANKIYRASVYVTAGGLTTYGPICPLPTGLLAPAEGRKLTTLNATSTTDYDSYVAIHSSGDGATLLALRAKVTFESSNCYLEKSTNRGETWSGLATFSGVVGFEGLSPGSQVVASADLRVIGVIISSNALGYGSLGRAYLSRDSGSTWEELTLPAPAIDEPWAYDAMALSSEGDCIALSYFTKPISAQETRTGHRPGIAVATLPASGSISWQSFPISTRGSVDSKLNSMHMTADGNHIVYSLAPTAPDSTTLVGQLARVFGIWIQGQFTSLGLSDWQCSFLSPDGNTLLATNPDSTMCSRDGGGTWETLPTRFLWRHPMSSSSNADSLLWISKDAATTNQIQQSLDGGRSITSLSNSNITFNWTSAACSEDGTSQIVAAYGDGTRSGRSYRGLYALNTLAPRLDVHDSSSQLLDDGSPLNLGSLQRNQARASNQLGLVLSNPADHALTELDVRITGSSASLFSVSGVPANRSLSGHGACVLSISFNGNSAIAGTKNAHLEISAGNPGSTITFPLEAVVYNGPQLALKLDTTPNTPFLELNEVLSLEAGATPLYLHNTGDRDLVLSALVPSTPRLSLGLSLPLTLSAGSTRALTLTLTADPNSSAAQRASLSFSSNSQQANLNLGLSLTQPELEVWINGSKISSDARPILMPNWALGGPTQSVDFTLRNNGSAPLRQLSFTELANAALPKGALSWNTTAASTLAAGQSSRQSVAFGGESPEDSTEGRKGATLLIRSNAPNLPNFLLNVEGLQLRDTRELSLQQANRQEISTGTSLSFGAVMATHPFGVNRVLHIQNLGNTVLGNLRLTLSGRNSSDFSLVQGIPASNARAGLDPSASLPIIIRFKPTGTSNGSRSATLTLTSNDSDEASTSITLNGSVESASQAAELFILGDGQSDVGQAAYLFNAAQVAANDSSPPASQGRTTHGALWADFLNTASLPYGDGSGSGRNLAVHRAGINTHPQQTGRLANAALSLSAQVDLLASKIRGGDGTGRFSSNQSVLLWPGQPDLHQLLYHDTPSNYASAIAALKTTLSAKLSLLSNLGATRLILVNQPNTASLYTSDYSQQQNIDQLIRLWNSKLVEIAADNSAVLMVDLNASHEAILAQSAGLRFDEAEQFGVSNPLSADRRLFWSPPTLELAPVASRRLHALWAGQLGIIATGTPEIGVKQGNTQLISKAALTLSGPTQIQIVNTGRSSLNALAWTVLGSDAAHFLVEEHDGSNPAPWANTYLQAPSGKSRESSPAHLRLNYNAAGAGASEAGLHLAVLRLTSSDQDEGYFDLVLQRGLAPAHQLITSGSALSLSLRGHEGHRYQWKKNNLNLVGENSSSLYLENCGINDGGAYSAEITTASGHRISIGSTEVMIVERGSENVGIQANRSATLNSPRLGCSAATRRALTYQWTLGNDPTALATTSTYTVNAPASADSSLTYHCKVIALGASVTKDYIVSRVDAAPAAPAAPAAAQSSPPLKATLTAVASPLGAAALGQALLFEGPVGRWVNQPTAHLASGLVIQYSASGLPPGLTMSAASGQINGWPTKAGTYLIKITFANAAGKFTLNQGANIVPMPSSDSGIGLLGAQYTGVAPRHDLNRQQGGRIDLTITSTGQLSGKLILGNTSPRSFTGGFDDSRNQDGTLAWNSTDILLQGTTSGPKLVLRIILNAEGSLCVLTQKESAINQVTQDFPIRSQASAAQIATGMWAGNYNMAMQPSETNPTLAPAGAGWLKMTVSPNALATLVGRASDGLSLTLSSPMAADGQFPIFMSNSPGQSLVSSPGLGLTQPAAGITAWVQTKLAGTATYRREANAKAANYPNGFATQIQQIQGGRAPSALPNRPLIKYETALFFKNPESDLDNVAWSQPDLGSYLEYTGIVPHLRLWWDGRGNSISVDGLDEGNGRPSFFINPSTGEVSGRMTLIDRNVIGADAKRGLVREVQFSGIVIRRASSYVGGADVLLPQGHCTLRRRPTSVLQNPAQMPPISLPWTLSQPLR